MARRVPPDLHKALPRHDNPLVSAIVSSMTATLCRTHGGKSRNFIYSGWQSALNGKMNWHRLIRLRLRQAPCLTHSVDEGRHSGNPAAETGMLIPVSSPSGTIDTHKNVVPSAPLLSCRTMLITKFCHFLAGAMDIDKTPASIISVLPCSLQRILIKIKHRKPLSPRGLEN